VKTVKITPLRYQTTNYHRELVLKATYPNHEGRIVHQRWYVETDITWDQLDEKMQEKYGPCDVVVQMPLFALADQEFHVGDLFSESTLADLA